MMALPCFVCSFGMCAWCGVCATPLTHTHKHNIHNTKNCSISSFHHHEFTHSSTHPPLQQVSLRPLHHPAAMHHHPSTGHVRLDIMERGGGGGNDTDMHTHTDTDTDIDSRQALTQQQPTQTASLPPHIHEENPLACSWSCFYDEFM